MKIIKYCNDENCNEYWDEITPDCKCGERILTNCEHYIVKKGSRIKQIYEAIRHNAAHKSVAFSEGDNKINIVAQTGAEMLIYQKEGLIIVTQWDDEDKKNGGAGWFAIFWGEAEAVVDFLNV